MAWYWPNQLDRIENRLDLIIRMLGRIMADEQALDQAISDLSAGQDELGTAIQTLLDKAAGSNVDLSDEIASIQSIQAKVQASKDAIAAAAAAPTPEEPPAEPV